jgi:hypothetical protein
MALVLNTTDGPVTVSAAAVDAVRRQAEFQADLTAACLDATGLFPCAAERRGNPVKLPAGFLLELAAALQLGFWELYGIRDRLTTELPSYNEAISDLAGRATSGPAQFNSIGRLFKRVLETWMRECGWDARAILQADVVVGAVDDESLVDAVAQLIWVHRHDQTVDNNEREVKK